MEYLQTKLNKLTDTSKYRLKANSIKEILDEFKKQMSKKETFNQAIAIDEKHHPVHVTHEKIIELIDEFINLDKFLKFLTLRLVIMEIHMLP